MLWERESFHGPTDLRKSMYYISALDIHNIPGKQTINIENKTQNNEKFL